MSSSQAPPTTSSEEELVEKVSLYNYKPPLLHGYALPFLILYPLWIGIWANYLQFQQLRIDPSLDLNLEVQNNETTNRTPTQNGTLDIVGDITEPLAEDESDFGGLVNLEAGFLGLAIIGLLQMLVYLCCHWSVHIRAFLTCSKVKSGDPTVANLAKVIPTPSNGSAELVRLQRTKGESDERVIISFSFQECKYEYNYETNYFEALSFPTRLHLKTYLNHKGFQEDEETNQVTKKFGANKTTMRIPSFKEFFIERATAPFFVFQVFCVLLWCLDEYWMYSVFTLFMLVVFECTLVQQQLRNMKEIRNMGNKAFKINVYRNRKWRPISSYELLPGDIVSVSPARSGSTGDGSMDEELIPCDMLLLRGSCIVDESMLTGESVPQMKEPIESEFNEEGTVGDDRALDLESDGKLRVLFGGTKLVQHSPPAKSVTALRAPDNGCVCYVLRTGFATSQGKLLRTIMYGVKRVTANNLESFAFIMFLLIFAIAAASYVWIKGTEDPDRNRYKLFLECTLILTSVVPPELPIELSLAVNSSVLSLTRLGVYCTEPFRIPFAGKTEICCFDKTGTLTSDNLIIDGVVSRNSEEAEPESAKSLPLETIQMLACCHALVTLEDGTVVGDPLEKATLKWIDWEINKDVAVPSRSGNHPGARGVKIFHRFHFSAALKRMSVVAGVAEGLQTNYFAAVKGAPEIMKLMFADRPDDYEDTYLSHTRRGARVLALGSKSLGPLSHQEVRQLSREDIESELKFLGFIVISCPLKPDSKKVIHEIMHASHKPVMITGDNALTACHVAQQLKMATKKHMLVFEPETLEWKSIDGEVVLPFDGTQKKELVNKYDLCLTGDGLSRIITYKDKDLVSQLSRLLPFIVVFARMAPKQKEWIINGIKNRGYYTLMCGDGTNDVGALKHAHVGVAILSHCPEWVEKKEKIIMQLNKQSPDGKSSKSASNGSTGQLPKESRPTASKNSRLQAQRRVAGGAALASSTSTPRETPMERQLKQMLKELEEQEKGQIIKLGDASIAAPFSSKMSSIECICHVIKQGRCTLVTTLQMFKILALNALILAYSQSVLYLDGVKLSDSQATFHGLLLAACFFFISHSKPLKVLSKTRPLPNIFNAYTLLTVFFQFFLHFFVLIILVQQCLIFAPEDRPAKVDLDKKFEPNLLNSVVYIISLSLQVTTFVVNYRGHPFMESITENRPFFYSILVAGAAVVGLITRSIPDMNEQFEIVPIPFELQKYMLVLLVLDVFGCFIMDRVFMWAFGEGKLRIK